MTKVQASAHLTQAKRAETVLDAFERLDVGRSTGYELRGRGLFPEFFKIGKRSYVLATETDQLIDARAAGASEQQIRELVRYMHAKRAEAGAALMATVNQGAAATSTPRTTLSAVSRGCEVSAQ